MLHFRFPATVVLWYVPVLALGMHFGSQDAAFGRFWHRWRPWIVAATLLTFAWYVPLSEALLQGAPVSSAAYGFANWSYTTAASLALLGLAHTLTRAPAWLVRTLTYLGHGSSQGEPAAAAYWSPEYTVDVLNAFYSLQKLKGVNPARTGMWGHSMGGHVALRAMTVNPRIKAGNIWAGVVGPYNLIFQDLPRWGSGAGGDDPRARMLARYGTPERNPALYRALSPSAFLADLRGRPLQLHHGTGDTHVPISFSRALAKGVKAAGQPSAFFTYPGDDHNLSRNLGVALRRSVEFFKNTL